MKNKNREDGLVYSTNPELLKQQPEQEILTPEPSQQQLRIKTEKNGRAGKVVTLIEGFVGNQQDLDSLAKKLKNQCGTGGSVKDGQVVVQGEFKQKIFDFLLKNGYSKTKLK